MDPGDKAYTPGGDPAGDPSGAPGPRRLAVDGTTLATLTGARFVGNLGYRWVYAFIPTIASGLGVSLAAMGVALTARDAVGLTAPAAGRAVDRGHTRPALLGGLVVAGAGSVVAGLSGGIVLFGVGLAVLAFGKIVYDTTMNAWIATEVPFGVRGRVTGLTEFSWALSFLVGVPLLALLIEVGDWRWPFFVMGVAHVAMVPPVLARLGRRSGGVPRRGHTPRRRPFARRRSRGRPRPTVVIFLGALAAAWVAAQAVQITFAAWLEDEFGLDVAGLGVTALLLGVAELVGTAATLSLTDRLGKRRAVRAGAMAMALPVALLPLADGLVVALMLLAGTVLAFEFVLISSLPLLGELDPQARGHLFGVGLAVFTAARAATSIPAAWLFTETGIGGVSVLACAALTCTFVALRWVPEPGDSTGPA